MKLVTEGLGIAASPDCNHLRAAERVVGLV
jgi:hypothetical protein